MSEDNSFLVLAYLWPSVILRNLLESNFWIHAQVDYFLTQRLWLALKPFPGLFLLKWKVVQLKWKGGIGLYVGQSVSDKNQSLIDNWTAVAMAHGARWKRLLGGGGSGGDQFFSKNQFRGCSFSSQKILNPGLPCPCNGNNNRNLKQHNAFNTMWQLVEGCHLPIERTGEVLFKASFLLL